MKHHTRRRQQRLRTRDRLLREVQNVLKQPELTVWLRRLKGMDAEADSDGFIDLNPAGNLLWDAVHEARHFTHNHWFTQDMDPDYRQYDEVVSGMTEDEQHALIEWEVELLRQTITPRQALNLTHLILSRIALGK